ncbi:CoA ester lyase [Rhodoblastus sp.]|uniref:HpcH/HpaI aldolase/citrate lyase family protein n=1 Tax=Rhodoblastus sp. TaxID=1962975 RepID=UPI0035B21F8C
MTSLRPRRSVLYMPGSNARALEKAKTIAADALILDLEDAVAPDVKDLAREQVVAAVKAGGFGRREVVIRVNGASTPWGESDLIAAAKAGPDAILIPKVSTPGDIMVTAKALRDAGAPDHTKIWAMMETPVAILNADSIVRTALDPNSRLAVLVMGTNDIAKETRARLTPGRPSMLAFLSICVAAARAHGVEIVDGVYNDFSNEAGFRAECEQGRDLGMDGKTLIHPNQVAICNEVFAPSEAEVGFARKIIEVFDLPENAAKGALQIDGKMVERLHADMARRTVAIADAIAGSA